MAILCHLFRNVWRVIIVSAEKGCIAGRRQSNISREFFMRKKQILFVLLGAISVFTQYGAKASTSNEVKYLQIQASYGPLEFVSNGDVVVRDPLGNIVASGKTNERGSYYAELSPSQFNSLPLKVVVTGGRLVDYTSKKSIGKKFTGHLKGQLDEFNDKPWATVYLDLVTSIASKLQEGGISYDVGAKMARDSLGIYPGAPAWALRFRNSYVDGDRFGRAVAMSNGFDAYVKKTSARVKRGKKILGLRPKEFKAIGSSIKAVNDIPAGGKGSLSVLATDQSKSLACSVPLPKSDPETGNSSELIKEFGVIAAQSLLEFAGAPKGLVTLGKGVTGMLLTGSGSGSDPTLAALEAVQQQLDCISAQLLYLDGEIEKLGIQIGLSNVADCEDAINTKYDQYVFLVDRGISEPLDDTNTLLARSIESWDPDGAVMSVCHNGKTINNMLWGTGGGRYGVWSELNENYQKGGAWYTQSDVQGLQSFLDYWSTLLYQEFVVSNEFYNYHEYYDDAKLYAGTAEENPLLCRKNSKNTTTSYCVYFSNIHNAYPADLYSDEIAFYNSGLAVIPFPAGLALGVGPNEYNPKYIFNHRQNVNYTNAYYSPLHAVNASIAFVPPLVNGESNCTFIPESGETFLCQRNKHDLALTKNQLQSLKQPGRGDTDAVTFLLKAMQDTPFVKSKLSPSQVGFFASDDVSYIVSPNGLTSTINTNALLNAAQVNASCGLNNYNCNYISSNTPIMATLLGRMWWPGSSGATNYYPPDPITE